nr:DNA repair protein Rad18 [Cryptococcus depauperatus CBS 7841]
MNNTHPLLENYNDPPPFPSNFSQLKRLDRSVLCQICKEPFTGPVSVACGHSFCSQMSQKSVQAAMNQSVKGLYGGIELWKKSQILGNNAGGPILIELATANVTRKRPALEVDSTVSNSSYNKRPKNWDRRRDNSDSPFESCQSTKSVDSNEEKDIEELSESGSVEETPCPICQAKLPISSIPAHIERGCPPPKITMAISAGSVKGNQKADWKKVFLGQGLGMGKAKDLGKDRDIEMKKITKPNYSLSSPSDLRALLSRYSLPTTGDKAALISRVQEWIILFNANLDTSHPSSLSALRAKLGEAEASRKRDKEKGRDEVIEQLGRKEGLQKYAQEKKAEFERLKREIMERDKRGKGGVKGDGVESAIEIE